MATPPRGTTELLFIAPGLGPSGNGAPTYFGGFDEPEDFDDRACEGSAVEEELPGLEVGPQLRMLPAAREAAAGMGITDAKMRRVLEDPERVTPDPSRPQRMRVYAAGVEMVVGPDGMILRVNRRRR